MEENWIWSEISYLLSSGVTFVMRSFCGSIGASGRLVKKTIPFKFVRTHMGISLREILSIIK